MALIRRRFAGVDYNAYHLLRSLVFFEDAETEPMPRMIRRACLVRDQARDRDRGEAALVSAYPAFAFFTSSVSTGRISNRSPTIP